MFVQSQKLASWLAIFSLILSSVLTLTHNHGQSCDCSDASHANVSSNAISVVAGLENLPQGDCDCSDCELPQQQHEGQEDHDEDTCSICRMVFEHANHTVEFDLSDIDEPICESVAIVESALAMGVVSKYLTRGPPTPKA